MTRRAWLGWLLLLALAVVACGRDEHADTQVPPERQLGDGEPVWVRHILVQYAGAVGANPQLKRTRAQADSLARALRERALAGEDFRSLAREYSDDASAADGGEMAALRPGETPPVFEATAVALAPGEISEVVESPYGFHVIQRRKVAKPGDIVVAQHILIRYAGAEGCPDSITRSREEALKLISRIHDEVMSPDASFPVAASLYSEDEVSAPRGGYVGRVLPGKMVKPFEDAVYALQENEISDIVESPYGFHIIRRIPDRMIRVSHILISYQGTGEIDEGQRSREEALELALDLAFRAKQGEDFAALAREYSDDSFSRARGGAVAPVRAGVMVPRFEDAAFRLKVGEVSDVVETRYGFHIIKRTQ